MRGSGTLLIAVAAVASADGPARRIAQLEDRAVSESSGVTASRRHPGIYWTHNDSGDGPVLYAFDREGHSYGRWTVRGARAVDWEDIAIGPGPKPGRWYLYIGDIGDNRRNRREVTVYRVEEPAVGGRNACRQGCATAPATAWSVRYPDGPHNAEALLVHPRSGDLYIVSKAGGKDRDTTVYKAGRADLKSASVTLTAVATLDVPDRLFATLVGGITGGEISPDGRRVVLCDYVRIYEARLPDAATDFDAVWDAEFRPSMTGGPQVEGVCYRADGKAILATSEGSPCPVFELGLP